MRKGQFIILLLTIIVAVLAGYWIVSCRQSKPGDIPVAKESTYNRVMRTQTIRCGYVVWSPFLIKEPNSGKLSGIFYDYTEALGQALHLKIEWAEEMGWGDFPTALEQGRVDAMCAGSWATSTRARVIDFVRPILYQAAYAYARLDDKRFDNNLDAINDPSIRIATVEGATGSVIAAHDFPNAKILELPQTSSLSEPFVNIVDGKADVVLINPATASEFDLHNPGKIQRIPSKTPLRVFGTAIAVAGGEGRLRRMLDLSTDELLGSGQIEKMIVKYEQFPGTLLRVGPPYMDGTAH